MTEISPGTAHTLALKLGEKVLRLEAGRTYSLGSAGTNDFRIAHASVAEEHLRITIENGKATIEILTDHATTKIGDLHVTGGSIEPGQTLLVGDIPVQLVRATVPAAPQKAEVARAFARHHRNESFQELMAEEMRRAPWFLISAVVHAVVLFLLYKVVEVPVGTGTNQTALMMADESEEEAPQEFEPERDDVPVEKEVVEEEVSLVEDLKNEFDAPEDGDNDDLDFRSDLGLSGETSGLMARIGEGASGDIFKSGSKMLAAGGFKKTISGIRRSGIEICFVFDSTGSMGSILQGTKERIAHMVDVLHALVPHARMSVVTYRDVGEGEEYATRALALNNDIYRSMNFIEVINAGGGGDRPEAVLEGLEAAFGQRWSKKARRVVILIGDAPAHEYSNRKIRAKVQSFVRNANSFVHAIVTSPYGEGTPPKDTMKSFLAIAKAGRGHCITFEDESKVLRQVMSLAFGRKYRSNIDEAYRIISERHGKIRTRYRDIVHREDLGRIEQELRRRPINDQIVKAVLAKPQQKTLAFLIDLMAKPDFPPAGVHAVSYMVHKALGLRNPPVAATATKPELLPRQIEALHAIVRQRFQPESSRRRRKRQ